MRGRGAQVAGFDVEVVGFRGLGCLGLAGHGGLAIFAVAPDGYFAVGRSPECCSGFVVSGSVCGTAIDADALEVIPKQAGFEELWIGHFVGGSNDAIGRVCVRGIVEFKSPSGEDISEIVGVEMISQADLPVIVQTTRGLGFAFGAGKRWQEHSGKNGDDRDDHEKFDQRKPSLGGATSSHGCVCLSEAEGQAKVSFHDKVRVYRNRSVGSVCVVARLVVHGFRHWLGLLAHSDALLTMRSAPYRLRNHFQSNQMATAQGGAMGDTAGFSCSRSRVRLELSSPIESGKGWIGWILCCQNGVWFR